MKIACVTIPRFAVEAERQRRKDIGARLILLGDNTVLDCSLGAEVSKVRRGMRMSEAIGLCPNAVVIAADRPYYERLFEEILDFLETMSPAVEGGETGIAYVAIDGLPTPPKRFAEDLIAGVHRRFGFMPSVGIAHGKFPASVAATLTRPGGVKLIPDGEEAAFLAPLSIDHLPAGDAMRWRLTMLGLGTISEVARLPLGAVQAQFGPEGKRCWELAQGQDGDPLLPRMREEAVIRRLQLPAPAATLEAILAGLEKLIRTAYGGKGGARWVRKAVVRGSLDGGGSWEHPVAFREALSDPRDAWFAVKNAVVRHPPEKPVEELEIELVGLSGESGKQAAMFDAKGKLWRQVEEAVRQLEVSQDSEQPAAIGKVVPLEPWSRIPERRAALADFTEK
jgi:protein ImuB